MDATLNRQRVVWIVNRSRPPKPAVSVATMGEKKINGRKRHIAVDTQGNLLTVVVHGAEWRDADGCWCVLDHLHRTCPTITHAWVDGGYRGIADAIQRDYGITLTVVAKATDEAGFRVLPRRWVVERTLAWLGRCRILSKEYTHTEEASETWVYLASIQRMLQRLAPNPARLTRYDQRSIPRQKAA